MISWPPRSPNWLNATARSPVTASSVKGTATVRIKGRENHLGGKRNAGSCIVLDRPVLAGPGTPSGRDRKTLYHTLEQFRCTQPPGIVLDHASIVRNTTGGCAARWAVQQLTFNFRRRGIG